MLDLVVGLDARSEMRIVRVGLQQAVCDWKSDQAGQCEDEEGEELGLDAKKKVSQRLEAMKPSCRASAAAAAIGRGSVISGDIYLVIVRIVGTHRGDNGLAGEPCFTTKRNVV